MTDSDNSIALPEPGTLVPPVPATLDLRRLWWMKLDVTALLNSTFNLSADDTGWRCGITLYMKAWHQVPASSLPDDDAMLCHLAGLGRDLETWRRVKRTALHGFAKCSDGRLYHPFLAAQALEAWGEFERMNARRAKDRERKRVRGNGDEASEEIPAENSLQDRTEQSPPSVPPDGAAGFDLAGSASLGSSDSNALERRPRSSKGGRKERLRSAPDRVSDADAQWRCRLAVGPEKPWLSSWGPQPGEPGCDAPAALVAASPWGQGLSATPAE